MTIVQFGGTTPAHAQSVSACDSYAHNYARSRTRGSVAGSAVRNTLVGAGIGSLVDGRSGARRGANLGLGAGIIGGELRRTTITSFTTFYRSVAGAVCASSKRQIRTLATAASDLPHYE